MKYMCEDQSGFQAEIGAATPQWAAINFCEDHIDTDVPDLPSSLAIDVTTQHGDTHTVYVEVRTEVTFHIMEPGEEKS